jgi:1-acyl-sn-glycerol-3-phosphate acyltransferase
MKKTASFLYSAYFWTILFLVALCFFPIALLIWIITVLFDKRLRILHYFTCFWSDFTLSLNPLWRIRIFGKERIVRDRSYVIVSNHHSGVDIIVMFKLWIPFKWVAKRSLFRVPFIGWNMVLNRYIDLDRGKKNSMVGMLDKAAYVLHSGISVMIFPEGTRSRDGNLKNFKTGAFHLALKAGSPVLPVAINGTAKAIDKKGFLILKNKNITATILEPIPFNEIKDKDPKEVAEMVQELISEFLKKS